VVRRLAEAVSGIKLGLVSSGAGTYSRSPFAQNLLTHNFDLYRRMQQTPYPIPGVTFGWMKQTFLAKDVIFNQTNLAKLMLPVLVLGGTDDGVVDVGSMQSWVQMAAEKSSCEVQLRLFPGARHELFSEIAEYYMPALQAVREWCKVDFDIDGLWSFY